LPANWKKLELSQAQREKIYSIRASYRKQISDLQAQIRAIRKKEMAEMVAVLTKEQKAKLTEGLTDAPKTKKGSEKE
jgi:Spy/CpxP family protein refolding chaperone